MPRAKVVPSDPDWETVKAARRPLSHADAVQEVWFLQRQFRLQWSTRMAVSPVDLNLILKTLTQKRIPFVLTGAHGIAGWTGKPRNTQDVDLLVKTGRNHGQAVNALQALYPQLEVRTFLGSPGVLRAGREGFRYRCHLSTSGRHRGKPWRILPGLRIRSRACVPHPSLERMPWPTNMAPCSRSRAIWTNACRMRWISRRMVQHAADEGQRPIDLHRLEILGGMVWPAGGGQEILRLIEKVQAGRAISLDPLG